MASLGHLSDHDLRKRLKEYGITSPVTPSTRDILLKRLNHLISNDKKASKNDHADSDSKGTPNRRSSKIHSPSSSKATISSSLNTFSSDEEEEEEFPSATRLRRSSRNSSVLSSNSTYNKGAHSSKNENVKTTPILRSSFSKKNIDAKPQSSLKFGKSRGSISTSRNTNYDTCSDTDGGDDDMDNGRFTSNSEAADHLSTSSSFEPVSYKNFRADSNFDIKKRNNLFSGGSAFNYKGFDTRYSFGSSRSTPDSSLLDIKSPDDVVAHESMSISLSNGQSTLEQSSKLSDQSFDGSPWLQSVPLFLVILFALFFGFLGLCYMNIHNPFLVSLQLPSQFMYILNPFRSTETGQIEQNIDESLPKKKPISLTFDFGDLKLPLCQESPKISCLTNSEVESLPDVVRLLEGTIIPALTQHASYYQCGNTEEPYLNISELKKLMQKKLPHKEEIDIQNGLTGLAKLMALKSEFGIEAFWQEEFNKDNLPELLGLTSSVKPTEIMCYVTSAFYNLAYFAAALALGGLTAWLAIVFFRFYKKRGEKQEEESFELVEKILDLLESSCGVSGKEFIAVNHVRDLLIAPRDRKAKSDIWNRAVKFIDDHDSRVYREIRNVGGEDSEVWRWVSGAPRSPISCPPKSALPDNLSPQEKIWQGQAFESLEITQNLPQVSPTSCLKIRNMFDSEIEFGEDWPCRIQDSILEKCESIPIVHITVDRSSKEGCVYLKCASAKAAGQAFRALHGSWFDGNLVTVKYLRDERYHERFPTARHAASPLSPSNNERLSLQHSLSSILPSNSIKSNQTRQTHSRGRLGKS